MQQGSTSFPLLCLFDSGSVFESKGKEILTDVSYQADIWLRYTNAHLNHIELIISNLISRWNLLHFNNTVIRSLCRWKCEDTWYRV